MSFSLEMVENDGVPVMHILCSHPVV